jgi:hypothetical protein
VLDPQPQCRPGRTRSRASPPPDSESRTRALAHSSLPRLRGASARASSTLRSMRTYGWVPNKNPAMEYRRSAISACIRRTRSRLIRSGSAPSHLALRPRSARARAEAAESEGRGLSEVFRAPRGSPQLLQVSVASSQRLPCSLGLTRCRVPFRAEVTTDTDAQNDPPTRKTADRCACLGHVQRSAPRQLQDGSSEAHAPRRHARGRQRGGGVQHRRAPQEMISHPQSVQRLACSERCYIA